MRHKTIHIEHEGRAADIDEMIAPLILEMWKAGIETAECCQNFGGRSVYIHFPDTQNAERFLNIVGAVHEQGLRSLYNRLSDYYYPFPENQRTQAKFWSYIAGVRDRAIVRGKTHTEDEQIGPPQFRFSVSIIFPQSDLEAVMRRLSRAR
jgi:hypothetical protein